MIFALVSAFGLSVELVERGIGAPLLESSPARRASLHCSFPCLPAVVERTVLAGAPAAVHGVMGAEDPPRDLLDLPRRLRAHDPGIQVFEFDATTDEVAWDRALTEFQVPVSTGSRLVLIHDDRILHAARSHGLHSPEHRHATAQVVRGLIRLVAPAGPEHVLLVHGGAPLSPVRRPIDRSSLPTECAWSCEGRIARTAAPAGARAIELRDRLLGLDGIARILQGRALELWDADPAAGWLVVAESDRSFEAHAADCGDRVDDPELQGVLLAWGGREGEPWPVRLHDYRIAPSIGRLFGVEWTQSWDRPFDI